jgi:hypothetical protein
MDPRQELGALVVIQHLAEHVIHEVRDVARAAPVACHGHIMAPVPPLREAQAEFGAAGQEPVTTNRYPIPGDVTR